MSFTHLHVHSHYSLLDGLPKIPQLVSYAKEQGFTSLGLTDHGVLYGAVEFYQECTKQGIKPIIGAEVYVAQRTRHDKQPRLDNKPYHLILLAETTEGYHNLVKLITRAQLEGYYYKPRIDFELLQEYGKGLIALSACLNGEVARAVLNNEDGVGAAVEVVQKYKSVLGENNFYLEVQHNPNIPEQQTLNAALKQVAEQTNTPLVATADSHYLRQEDAEAQDILLCIQTKKQLSDTDRMTMRDEDYSLLSGETMSELFSDFPNAVANAGVIAERCNVEIELGKFHMPYYEIPDNTTHDAELRRLCEEGLVQKYGGTEFETAAVERLDYELSVITKTGYASYFLIVQDLVNWSKQNGIVVGPGRGSAAGSIVAFLTNITAIDPLRYDLLFERFLNPERVSMPDIDLDIADVRRDEVLAYVASKYGHDHVAQIITFGTMAARAAVRDVGRVLGLSYGYCDGVAKLIPMFTSLKDAIQTVPELKDLYESDPDATRLLDSALKLEGVVRHTSTHACGVVITEESLDNYTPLQYSSTGDNSIVTQYELHSVEALGLLKMDFLGLKNLTVIEDAIGIIKKTTGDEINIDTLPLDNSKAYQLLKKGQTTGIFQLESAGMKRYLKQLKPTEFEDIIAMVALYRPGPMERIPDYIEGKHGKREVTYLHPKLEPVLNKTYGILVYQEQVMSLVRDLAGFTAGEGYLLIKAVAKKIKELLDEQRNRFIAGCIENGVSEKIAHEIWETIEPFASYGFNKSHSTGYALIAYQTAFLKANYPAQFMAALLTSDQHDSDRVAIEVSEARELGIEVLPPDINESFSTFTVVKESLPKEPRIRFGLAAIKNVGEAVVRAIIDERKVNGQFIDIEDFLRRIQHKDLNRKSLESLIKCGAMNALGDSATLLYNVEFLLQFHKTIQAEKASGQTSLFGEAMVQPKLKLETAPDVPRQELLHWERELLGLYVSEHPMQRVLAALKGTDIMNIAECLEQKNNTPIRWVAMVSDVRQILTRKGEPMQFVKCEDAAGESEAIIFPKAMANIQTVLQSGTIALFTGQMSKRNGDQKLIIEQAEPFNDSFVLLQLGAKSSDNTDKQRMLDIKEILAQHGGNIQVYAEIDGRLIKADSKTTPESIEPLKQLLGEDAVILV